MSEQSEAGNGPLQLCPTTFKVTLFRSKTMDLVLCLEAGKDLVDTLFSFLVLPVGTILHILSQGVQVKPVNGVASIFASVESSFLCVDEKRLVQPGVAAPSSCACRPDYGGLKVQRDLEAANILQRPKERRVLLSDYYKCGSSLCSRLYPTKMDYCYMCRSDPSRYPIEGPFSVQEKDPNKDISGPSNGFVKESIIFIITDKLEITPSTTSTWMSLLSKLGFNSFSDLERSEIDVSVTQILQLLSSSLTSSTCLNDVFGVKNTGAHYY